jgi:hypothetical protein
VRNGGGHLCPGYDVLLDRQLRPHLLEINSRPSIYTEVLDAAVNGPLVEEMFRVVGFHLPEAAAGPDTVKEMGSRYGLTPGKAPAATFLEEVYTRSLTKRDLEKQGRYSRSDREEWVEGLIDEDLLPADIRCLVKVDPSLDSFPVS